MPLLKGSSKKAFQSNLKTELGEGKSKAQSLAISYSMQKKPKKKLALGGAVEGKDFSKHPYDKTPATPAPKPDDKRLDKKDYMGEQWASGPDPIRKPDDMRPAIKDYMSDHEQMLADGGEVTADSCTPEELKMIGAYRKKMAMGGMAENDNEPSMPKAKKDDMRPSEEEYMSTDHMAPPLARGGMIHEIMKRKKMADGGEVDLNLNSMEQPNSYYKRNEDDVLKENYDSDFKNEKQSLDSNEHGDKLEDEDSHDMISKLRSKMKLKRGL